MKTIEGYTYKVNEHIGKGYSSTVHKGVHDKTGQDVSIKVIQMAKLQDPINQMLLQLEVTALKHLAGCKHILHLHDVYATKNNTYLITELCQGDLNSIIKQRKTLPYHQAVQIMKQLIQGYYDIHRVGYVHRDIKPANIFHKQGVYKFGDFGFTIPVTDIPQHKHYNVGSPVYMPPEALKENNYSVSCDIWAIGIIFYQLLKGSVPWRALSENVLYEKMMNQPLETLTTGMPQPAKRFLSQVLNLNPAFRPTPDKLRSWPTQLMNANIEIRQEIRHLSPFEQRGRQGGPLKEIQHNNSTSITFVHQNQRKPMGSLPSLIKNKTLQEKPQSPRGEETQFKQAYFFANNWINYLKFLHRTLKFVENALPLSFEDLSHSLTKSLFDELQNLKNTIEEGQNQPKIEDWKDFLKSARSQLIRKKLKKYQSKYNMFHTPLPYAPKLQPKLIIEAVNTLVSHLDSQGYVAKLVVAADYLTTLYQLHHLHDKYSREEFMKISKIDLIMQGNPYNTNSDHYQKLKKKLLLIKP